LEEGMTSSKQTFAAMRQAVIDGESETAERLAREALAAGIVPLEAIEQGFVPGIQEAGRLWEEGEYFLPELVTSAEAMQAAMALLQPALQQGQKSETQRGRVVIGTVHGDIHDIGKTLVGTLLSANGFEVHDEGADVSVERFVEKARAVDADLVCASALLTTTMVVQRELVSGLASAGLRAKVMVGGAPVTKEWATQIAAHGFADNAVAAVEVARQLVAS
jgi:trimethylamine corrinoid protein